MKAAAVAPSFILLLGACSGGVEIASSPPVPPSRPPVDLVTEPSPTSQAPAAGTSENPRPATVFQLLHDMEDGNENVVSPVGLASWFGGGIVNLDPPRQDSKRAQSGSDDLRLDIHGPKFQAGALYPDLSAYAGVAFWARARSHGETVLVALEDEDVAGFRGYAEARASAKAWFETEVKLSSDWRRHIVLFEDVKQPGHPDRKLRTQAIWSVHFMGGGAQGRSREYWIDDLALLCRGACPRPAWDLPPKVGGGFDEQSLPWARGPAGSPEKGCAELAALSMASLDKITSSMTEKAIFKVRIPTTPSPSVPLWSWTVRDGSGRAIDVTGLDEGFTTVAFPVVEPGEYQITAHTHYPGTAVCGVEVRATATR
jgi:hypothetical protein